MGDLQATGIITCCTACRSDCPIFGASFDPFCKCTYRCDHAGHRDETRKSGEDDIGIDLSSSTDGDYDAEETT